MNTSIQSASSLLMSPEGLAEMIGVRKSTLATWRHKGIGPAYVKLGKKVFYHTESVQIWISKNVVQPEAPVRDERQTELAV